MVLYTMKPLLAISMPDPALGSFKIGAARVC